ncbi:multidrug transporter [Clostridium botulinum]|uniref:Multidrug efflux pump, outer membrane protein n=1 Tax=Clostridium botulinum (strain Eklund 17B / Type B) TaxID=935198 RepID=B2TIS3_CLOBB|nr:putative multidrug efflux pump, outer membrane protein [Clostridium botulinum B str. Eklund 17B (NRP)]MBY6977544.1 TolC family protein [Clostridium botulinum]MBY7001752.1 TolC family protein [Clostridium botulinum]MCR1275473.1 TolC family protein [Clostridium botulinum]NFD70921.1 multidrug transporter [Clostridium botulinum]
MKKGLKRLVALTIAGLITSISLIQIPANANTSKPILSLEKAIDSAIDNSYQIVLNEEKQDMLEEKDDFYQDVDMDDDGYNDIQMSQNEQKRKFLEDQISVDVTSKYNSMVILEKELENIVIDIEIKTKEYENMELKKKIGLVSTIEMQNAKAELEKLKAEKKSKEQELKNSKKVFKIITDIDVEDYDLEDNVKFKPLKLDESLDSYLDDRIDTYFRYNKKLADWVEDNYSSTAGSKPTPPNENDYKDEEGNTKPEYKDALNNWSTNYYNWISVSLKDIESEYNANTAVDSVNDGKRTMKQTLLTTYTKLVTLEGNITSMKAQLDVLYNKTKITKLQYDLGLATKQEYYKQLLTTEQLEVSYNSLINSYNDLKEKIEKPWTLSSGM